MDGGVPGGKGTLEVRVYKGRPFFETRWRDGEGKQRRRRLGPAWVEVAEDGSWSPRRGRVRGRCLDERRAYPLMAQVIEGHEEKLRLELPPEQRDALFDDAADAWLAYLKTERRAKPSTIRDYEVLLARPGQKRRKRGGNRPGRRIMTAFGGKRLFDIRTRDVRSFLARLDRENLAPRTVNKHRQVLHAIFEFAHREESFGLPVNPAAGTVRRPEDGTAPIDTFEPAEIRAVTAAARAGLHRRRSGYKQSRYSVETEREWQRINEQDASLYLVAAATGLRLGELGALRWRDIDLKGGILTVSRAMSDGEETSTKSRRPRIVPLAGQAREELERLRRRVHFTGREDFVFCRPDGGPLDRSGVRTRFIRAQAAAGVRVRRFHDLRHTFGSLAIRRFDLVAVKEMMGHSKLTTTERYLHSKPRPNDAAKLTAIFAEDDDEGELRPAA
ncbi:MAG: tyrosine-type recombinase/integrase [Actinobacteria bacterium]|nr:tyrosine-type recombinase/integrase [Actinomycetota bacterium]